ncbi:MAG: YebC/PmpR family DNA-binding transcriptional regulator [Cytophagales bacterium]|nr:MAG: YebC/PmpR family DNA-binding transcriptional regulator [Cytophagales bacterium]
MGRAFEFRKGRKMKRWDAMAKAFTKFGREIAMSVKQSGPDPNSNSRLRVAIQNAKGANMPKDKIENAIKRASSKDEKDFEELVYEGYGPYGVAILAECATDNPTRTVSNIRMYFNRGNGTLGKTGSLDFIFTRKGIFKLSSENLDIENLELELIDFGLEEITKDEEENLIIIQTSYTDFGIMQKAIEDKNINIINAELKRIPNTSVKLTEEQEDEIMDLLDKFEEDEDVQAVYSNVE